MESGQENQKTKIELFCCQCFASESDGSWNHAVVGEPGNTLCTNCGGINTSVPLPRRHIESIRVQASWVGKRYYPQKEDHEIQQERAMLLATIKEFPGRTAIRVPEGADSCADGDRWTVIQKMPDGEVRTSVIANSAEEAMRKCGLRYVSAESLEEAKEKRI